MFKKRIVFLTMILSLALFAWPGSFFARSQSLSPTSPPAPTPAPIPVPQLQTITPIPITGVIKNPGIGYQTFYRSAISDTRFPSSTMYTRVDWSQVEPAPGVFNFSVIDKALSSAKAAGQRLAFRIMGFERGNLGPVGLKNAGFPGFTFNFRDTSGVWFPDLSQKRRPARSNGACFGARREVRQRPGD